MIVVDTFLVHSKATELLQTQNYQELNEELIDNTYDGVATPAQLRLVEGLHIMSLC
jgi:hypothetical protein